MHRLRASLVLALVLAGSLAAKGLATRQSDAAPSPDAYVAAHLLTERGFDVTFAPPNTAPVWTRGVKGNCLVRIADVAPQGWFRAIVAQEAQGQWMRYAFGGRFYEDQPVWLTNFAEYQQRLLRYFGLAAPPPAVRAILVSPGCPEGTIGPGDAAKLS